MKLNFLIIFASFVILFTACKEEKSNLELPVLFSNEMVLQQQTNVAIWGTANPGSKITIQGNWGESTDATAQEDGKWLAKLETPEAGGPYEVTFQNDDSTLVLKDVLVGEVWLCSGQSNMEMLLKGISSKDSINYSRKEIAEANYPKIRMFTVQREFSIDPLESLKGSWATCTPENAPDFSATAYFFGLNLYKELNVPIGLIHSSWGGSPVEAWIERDKILKDEDFIDYGKNISKLRTEIDTYTTWLNSHKVADLKEEEGVDPLETTSFSDSILSKVDFDDSKWPLMGLPAFFEKQLGNIDGVIWYRKNIEIPEKLAGKELELNLGPIDDRDWVYLNGKLIASTPVSGKYNVPRKYTIPADLAIEGTATLAIRIVDHGGGGGFFGNPEDLNVKSGKDSISLKGEWKYLFVAELFNGEYYLFDITKNELKEKPTLTIPYEAFTPSFLYNGMISPIIPYTIKGTIWYQGESNVGRSNQYIRLFSTMIENWRQKFENPEMPFYFVQIAPYNYGDEKGSSSAMLRDAQRRSLSIKNTGMAVTLDIGDVRNIHPSNKQDVGKRLALWALAKDYGKEIAFSGPLYEKMEVDGSKVRISFTQTNGGLKLTDENTNAFELAGADSVFYPAQVIIDGEQIVLTSNKVTEPKAAKYAFTNGSSAILLNGEGLPASSFTTEEELQE